MSDPITRYDKSLPQDREDLVKLLLDLKERLSQALERKREFEYAHGIYPRIVPSHNDPAYFVLRKQGFDKVSVDNLKRMVIACVDAVGEVEQYINAWSPAAPRHESDSIEGGAS